MGCINALIPRTDVAFVRIQLLANLMLCTRWTGRYVITLRTGFLCNFLRMPGFDQQAMATNLGPHTERYLNFRPRCARSNLAIDTLADRLPRTLCQNSALNCCRDVLTKQYNDSGSCSDACGYRYTWQSDDKVRHNRPSARQNGRFPGSYYGWRKLYYRRECSTCERPVRYDYWRWQHVPRGLSSFGSHDWQLQCV